MEESKKKEKYLQINHFTLKITENKSRKYFCREEGLKQEQWGWRWLGKAAGRRASVALLFQKDGGEGKKGTTRL